MERVSDLLCEVLSFTLTQPNIYWRQGQSELHRAAARGDAEAVRQLLGSGVDPDARDGDGCSPLHWAADRGHLEVRGA